MKTFLVKNIVILLLILYGLYKLVLFLFFDITKKKVMGTAAVLGIIFYLYIMRRRY